MAVRAGKIRDRAWLKRERRWRQASALVLTATACFFLINVAWPLTVTGFKSTSRLIVRMVDQPGAEQDFQQLLARTIRDQMTDQLLQKLFDQSVQSNALTKHENNRQPESYYHDIAFQPDSLRGALSIATQASPTPGSIQITCAIKGNGTRRERVLVRLIAQELAEKLQLESQRGAIDIALSVDAAGQAINSESIDQLDWLVTQLEADLSDVRDSVLIVNENNSGDGRFRSVSNRGSQNPSLIEVQQALGSIDITAVRKHLNQLKKSTTSPAVRPSASTDGELSRSEPIGAMPSLAQVVLAALFSTGVGMLVAINFQPFAKRGFRSTGQIAGALQIPVIATLPGLEQFSRETCRDAEIDSYQKLTSTWANQVVKFAALLLVGAVIITMGFCLISQDIGHAFLSNPYDGFARMFRVFVGY